MIDQARGVEGDVRHAHRCFKSHCPEWRGRGACHRARVSRDPAALPTLQCLAITSKSGSSPAATKRCCWMSAPGSFAVAGEVGAALVVDV